MLLTITLMEQWVRENYVYYINNIAANLIIGTMLISNIKSVISSHKFSEANFLRKRNVFKKDGTLLTGE